MYSKTIYLRVINNLVNNLSNFAVETKFLLFMNVYIKLPQYLTEWVLHDFGDENGVVRFPRGSAENDVLEHTLTKPPKDMVTPPLKQPDEIAIELPSFKSKPLPYYWWLNNHAKEMLCHIIYVRFRVLLWSDLHKVEHLELPITDLIYEWMLRHGIDDNQKSWETIRQIYFRQRKQYAQANRC